MNDTPLTPPGAGGGALPGGVPTVPCAPLCPTDFTVDAPCRIIKAGGGRVTLSANDLPGFQAGTFTWTSSSAKIRLITPNAASVTVEGLAAPSASRDAETITVTRTATGCSPVSKTVTVTVAKVTFSQAATQRYGYDDFDTPADPLDDHVSIKKSDHSFVHVVIEGGALGTDFDFVCDTPATCTPVAPGGTATFDLRLDAGAVDKAETPLHAKVKCPSAESFAHIAVNVYKEKLIEVVVAKIFDSTVAATALNFPTGDYAAHTATINAKTKEAVLRFDITNYDAANGQTDVRYDLDNNGVVSYDIGNNGGAELTAIAAAMTGTGTRTRIAIVRNMKSFYFLAAAAHVGDTTVTVTAAAASVFTYPPGRSIPLGSGASLENVRVASKAGSVLTLAAPLTKEHLAGAPIEYPAAGWSSDPILIIEGGTSLDVIKWTIPHEAGHRTCDFADVNDRADFMHFSQDWTDHRLRYCPRTKQHETGTENQWEHIPR